MYETINNDCRRLEIAKESTAQNSLRTHSNRLQNTVDDNKSPHSNSELDQKSDAVG